MTTQFPTAIDAFTNPSGSDEVGVDVGGRTHSEFHSDNNDAIEALEAKVGVDSSAVTTSHDYKLGEVTGSDKAVGKTATQTLTNKTLTDPVLNGTITGTGVVPLAQGGTGQALVDPNADRIVFWDDSDGAMEFLEVGSGLNLTGNTLSSTAAAVVTIETTAGATHSLTTTAGQKVVVWAKGNSTASDANTRTLELKYNGVTKDTVTITPNQFSSQDGWVLPFALMYTETPGAATQDITVTTSNGSVGNVVIIVQIIT